METEALQEKWWFKRYPMCGRARDIIRLNSWEYGFASWPVWHQESFSASLGLLSLCKIGIVIIPQKVILRITWDNTGKVLSPVPNYTKCSENVICNVQLKWWIIRLEGTLMIIYPLLPLTAEHEALRSGPQSRHQWKLTASVRRQVSWLLTQLAFSLSCRP